MAKLWQFSQGHPKPAFSEKVQRGDQGKCFKNRSKRSPRLKFFKNLPKKALVRKAQKNLVEMALSSNEYELKDQRLGKILAHKAAHRVPELPSFGNFRMVTKNPHFLKKFKGRTNRNFSKIAQKVAPV